MTRFESSAYFPASLYNYETGKYLNFKSKDDAHEALQLLNEYEKIAQELNETLQVMENNETLKQDIEALQVEKDDLEQEIKEIMAERDELMNKVEELEDELDELKGKLEELEA